MEIFRKLTCLTEFLISLLINKVRAIAGNKLIWESNRAVKNLMDKACFFFCCFLKVLNQVTFLEVIMQCDLPS